jgi:hypothetical protein
MKKLFFLIVACSLVAIHSSAQEQSFAKNDNVVSLGVGFGGNLYNYSYYSGMKRIPLLSFGYERCIIGNLFNDKSSLGVGAIVDYTSAKWDSKAGYTWKSTSMIIGAKGALHYAFVDKLDTYAGFILGYNIVSWKETGVYSGTGSSAASGIGWSFFAGARYYFTNNIGVFGEIGWGYTLFKAGLAFKF